MNGSMMSGNNGPNSASPTSNLFPSIASLFQSPIGTPRVTPTPQHFAAYLFNEDQFHSLIFPSSFSNNNSSSQSCNEAFLDAVLSSTSNLLSGQSQSSMIGNAYGNGNDMSGANMLSPLPLFNNLIASPAPHSAANQNASAAGQPPADNNVLNTPTNNMLSANN